MTIEQFIEKHEGRRKKPYKCPAGANTIGVGWNMDANPLPKTIADYLKKHGEITDDMVNILLSISVSNAIKDCLDLFPTWDDISLNRRMALIDVMFNMGKSKIINGFPTMVHNVNIGDWQGVADELKYVNGKTKKEFSWYWKQTKGRAQEITDLIEAG